MDKKSILLQKFRKKPSKVTAGLIGIFALCLVYKFYLWVNTEHTDNAYVQADITMLSSQINGTVKEILVQDNQLVKKGDVIAHIEDTRYKAAFEQSKNKLETAKYASKITDQQRMMEKINFSKLTNDKKSAEIKYEMADKDHKRNLTLKQNNFVSQKALDASKVALENAREDLSQASFALETSKEHLILLDNQYESNLASISDAEQALIMTKKDLDNTVITSPIDGIVASSGIRIGNTVTFGTPLVYLVPREFYIIANFKETQITNFYPGQKVELKFDSLEGKYQGIIRNISPASGATFSLIPVDNATGNFTKIVQRVPVKIDFDYHNPNLNGIVVGMSTSVSVDTRS